MPSFSQVETAVVQQMEDQSEFEGRGDPQAIKGDPTYDLRSIVLTASALRQLEINYNLGKVPTDQFRSQVASSVGQITTLLVRYCALRDINIVLAFAGTNNHLRF